MRVEIQNLVDCYQTSCARYGDRPALGTKTRGAWSWTSYRELAALVDRVRGGLAMLGVGPGDVVAIVSNNRVEWAAACYATYGLEASFVPMYEAQRAEEHEFILADSGAKVAIASTPALFHRLVAMQPELPALENVVGIDLAPEDPRSLAALARIGDANPAPARSPDPKTIAGLIYTSGTTGKPKGVILSHGNLASNVVALSTVFPLETTDRTLSFLPWAHSFGQIAELHYGMSQGASLALNDALPNLIENLHEVRPTVLVAVPRVFNRIHAKVQMDLDEKPGFVRRLVEDGIRSAIKQRHGERLSFAEKAELSVDRALVFRRIRERLGGRLRLVVSASAALSPEIAEFVDALGIPVYEGYGLTETSPAVTANTPEHRKLGSAGRPLPGVRVVIDESRGGVPGRGEIVVYGPNVMQGYHHRPEETASALTPDGGLRTGDLGYLDDEGYLFITGRIKEQFKLENGKYVMPSPLEEQLKVSPYIANVVLHGANRPYVVAIVAPNVDAVKAWADAQRVRIDDPARDPRVRALIERELAEHSRGFAPFEVPKKALILGRDLSTDDDLVTPTLKVKRAKVESHYADALGALYRETPPAAEAMPPP